MCIYETNLQVGFAERHPVPGHFQQAVRVARLEVCTVHVVVGPEHHLHHLDPFRAAGIETVVEIAQFLDEVVALRVDVREREVDADDFGRFERVQSARAAELVRFRHGTALHQLSAEQSLLPLLFLGHLRNIYVHRPRAFLFSQTAVIFRTVGAMSRGGSTRRGRYGRRDALASTEAAKCRQRRLYSVRASRRV